MATYARRQARLIAADRKRQPSTLVDYTPPPEHFALGIERQRAGRYTHWQHTNAGAPVGATTLTTHPLQAAYPVAAAEAPNRLVYER